MSIGSILLGLALLIVVGLVLAQPFLTPQEREVRPRSRKQQLLAQKEAVLEEIRLLDFDFDTGKIHEEAYQPQRDQLMAFATAVLKELDTLGETAPSDDVAAQIEAAVSRVRAQKQGLPEPAFAPVKATAVPANGQTQFCPQCGVKVSAGDKFCAACGHKLVVPV